MVRGPRSRRGAVLALLIPAVVCAGLVGPQNPAVAEPRKSLSQVQAEIDSLNREAEHAGERYNDARVRLTEVNRRLGKVRKRLARQQSRVGEMQTVIGRLAAASYKSGGVDIALQLLLSEDPEAFLLQASALDQLSKQQRIALREMTRVRQDLAAGRAEVAQERARIVALKETLTKERSSVETQLAAARRLLGQLTSRDRARLQAQQMAAAARAREGRGTYVRASRDSRSGDPAKASYDGPASGRAAIAVRTAYAQLGDPYRWGGTGPNSFDCSGLTAYAWASAGVSLPHSSAAQYSSGRKISRSELRPGDLVFFYSPISHVAIYIGGGKIIDAPYPGKSVHITSISVMPYVGAVRP